MNQSLVLSGSGNGRLWSRVAFLVMFLALKSGSDPRPELGSVWDHIRFTGEFVVDGCALGKGRVPLAFVS